MLGKNDASAETGAVRFMAAFSDSIESIAGRNDPCVRGRALTILAVVLEYRWIFWRQNREVIDRLVGACRKTGCGYIMTQNAAIDDLSEERRARDKVAQHVRDILLAFGSERLLITGAAAKSNHHDFSVFR